jgi:hypothetical protein
VLGLGTVELAFYCAPESFNYAGFCERLALLECGTEKWARSNERSSAYRALSDASPFVYGVPNAADSLAVVWERAATVDGAVSVFHKV